MEDSNLWKGIKRNDKKALKELHNRYYHQMFLYASKSFQVIPGLAQELVSDCFITLWENRKKIEIHKSVKYYLYLMLRNNIIDHFRKKRVLTEVLEQDFPTPGDETLFDEQQEYARLYQAIEKLPEQCRKILELAAFESLTYDEIAEKLKISKNTVKTQMGRAYKQLRETLDPKDFNLFLVIKKHRIRNEEEAPLSCGHHPKEREERDER
jgi:RNA polymerase sigma-70 factor (ECF subfamily)